MAGILSTVLDGNTDSDMMEIGLQIVRRHYAAMKIACDIIKICMVKKYMRTRMVYMNMSKWLGVILVLALFTVVGCATRVAAPPDDGGNDGDNDGTPTHEMPYYAVRAVNSMVKILPTLNLNTLASTIHIEGMKGEHEAFQVIPVLDSETTKVKDVMLQADNLVKGSDIIPKGNISIYKEYYLKVIEPSDKGGQVGYWPDALVPLTDPFEVSSDFPCPLWVDVNIPRDASPGVYTGKIFFTSSDGGNSTFQYEVEVWDITLPRNLFMKANFGLDQEDIAREHGLEPGLGSPDGREMARTYAKFLADRHITANCLPIFRPKLLLNADNRSFSFDFTEMEKDIVTFLDGYDLSSFAFPLNRFDLYPKGAIGHDVAFFSSDFNARLVDYIEQVAGYFQTRGYLDRSFIQFIDEPYTEEQYQFVRDISDVVRQASIYPNQLVPEQPCPEHPEWGSLHDYVDIFVTAIAMLKLRTEDIVRKGGEDRIEWVYTNAAVYPYPSVAIDRQGIEPRIFVWLAYQDRFTGIFYSSVSDWTTVNPWENPLTFGHGMGNGCNCLLYPGTYCREFAGQANVNGPIASMRLEQTRDGLEDAQMLYILGRGSAVEQAKQLYTAWEIYTNDPEELLRVRREIAQAIMNGG